MCARGCGACAHAPTHGAPHMHNTVHMYMVHMHTHT